DVARFRDLYRAENPAASLRASVDDPSQSPRFAAFLRRLDFYDELRVVCRANDVPWALITMWRRQGEFSERDVDLMASLSAPVAPRGGPGSGREGPGDRPARPGAARSGRRSRRRGAGRLRSPLLVGGARPRGAVPGPSGRCRRAGPGPGS